MPRPGDTPATAFAGPTGGFVRVDTVSAPASLPALQLTSLVKRFGEKVAVAGLDLVVPSGSFFGLVGPNGAGKTTTLSMATGLLRPDAGEARVHGIDVWQRPVEAKRIIGNLADGVRLFDRLTGEQLITYTAMMFGIPRDDIAPRASPTCSNSWRCAMPPGRSSPTTPPA